HPSPQQQQHQQPSIQYSNYSQTQSPPHYRGEYGSPPSAYSQPGRRASITPYPPTSSWDYTEPRDYHESLSRIQVFYICFLTNRRIHVQHYFRTRFVL